MSNTENRCNHVKKRILSALLGLLGRRSAGLRTRSGGRLGCGSCRRRDDGGGLDEVELGPALVEVWLALLLDLILVRSPTRGRTFAVLIIEHVDDFYPVGNQAEWCEPIVIQSLVVPEVDEHLCGARVRPSRSKRHIATGITLRNGVVLNVGILPNLIDSGIGADAELRHEARKDAE